MTSGVSAPRAGSLPPIVRQPPEWAGLITAAWQKSTSAIIETGLLLKEAKTGLDHGQWAKMVQAELPFNERTAQRLMAIAQHPVLSNTTHVSHLPSSWATLYELTRIPNDQLKAKLSDGSINPRTERRDVAALLPNSTKMRPRLTPPPPLDPLVVLQQTWDVTPKGTRHQFTKANAPELKEILEAVLEQAPASPADSYPDLPAFLDRGNPSCGRGNEMTGKDDGADREPF
jgi:hypothetical protein